MDYIKGGTQLHCSIAIDFTGIHYLVNGILSREQLRDLQL
jgi:hypothetical protein